MYDVDTLFVVSSGRGDYVLDDMLSMISWSATGGSHFTVIVDESRQRQLTAELGRYTCIHTPLPYAAPPGFHRAAGLQWAVEKGIAYRQVVMLSDTCLVMTQGVDGFFMPHVQRDGVGVIGVRTDGNREPVWRSCQTQLFEWGFPLRGWEQPPVSLCDDFLVLSPRFSAAMAQQAALLPPGCETWAGTYGDYISWACHLLGLYTVSWGFETKPLPPVYVSRAHGLALPPPHLFGQRLMVFAPIDRVMGYSEGDIRELYKQQRGDRSREVPRHQPVVTGPEQSDVSI